MNAFKLFLSLVVTLVAMSMFNPNPAYANGDTLTLEDCQKQLVTAGITEPCDDLDECKKLLAACKTCGGGKSSAARRSSRPGPLARKLSIVERDVKEIKEALLPPAQPAGTALANYAPPKPAFSCDIRWKRNLWVSLGAGVVTGVVTSLFSEVRADDSYVDLTSLPFKVGTAVTAGTFGGLTIYDANRCD